MAIKKISQFTSGTPTDNDYILFEQNGAGKSARFGDFSLSYEEIMATTNLSGKVASASAVKEIGGRIICGRSVFPVPSATGPQTVDVSFGVTLPNAPKVVLLTWSDTQSDVYNFVDGLQANKDSYSTTGFQAIAYRKQTPGAWNFVWIAIY